jgi:hypothetical protein
MIEQAKIIEAMYNNPFRPFKLILKNGAEVPVTHPADIATPGSWVGVTKVDEQGELTDESWEFPRADVERLEYAEDAALVEEHI